MATIALSRTAALPARTLERVGEITGPLAQQFSATPADWLSWVLRKYVDRYLRRGLAAEARKDGIHPAITRARIRRACVQTALSGLGASTFSTFVGAYSLSLGGSESLLAVPVSSLAMGAEAAVRGWVLLRLSCDLQSAHGVALQRESLGDLDRLYLLLTHRLETTPEQPTVLHRLLGSGSQELGKQLGKRLLGESFARSVLPVVGIVSASVGNWRSTSRLGEAVVGYARRLRALEVAQETARRVGGAQGEALLLEGAWFLFSADGILQPGEAVSLAHQLERLSPSLQRELLMRLVDDESEWLARLHQLPARARKPLLGALVGLAVSVPKVSSAERRLLGRAARALHLPLPSRRLDAVSEEVTRAGKATPRPHKAVATSSRKRSPAVRRAARSSAPAIH